MSEHDKRHYEKTKADPVRYAAYLERKRLERLKRQTDKGYETSRKRGWRAANPEDAQRLRQAHHRVETALRNGTLVRPKACSDCGTEGPVQSHHHHGYEQEHWLDVVWLCALCHGKKHRR